MPAVSDGVIVGSAIVDMMARYGKEAPPHVGAFVKEMKDRIRKENGSMECPGNERSGKD